jgi:hypothetical protein
MRILFRQGSRGQKRLQSTDGAPLRRAPVRLARAGLTHRCGAAMSPAGLACVGPTLPCGLPTPASHAAAISPTARRGSSESSRAAASTRSVPSELANCAESGRAAARSGHVLAHHADCRQDRLLLSRLREDAPPSARAHPCCAPPLWGRADGRA